MGTNYYFVPHVIAESPTAVTRLSETDLDKCFAESWHIGKDSAGWVFALQVGLCCVDGKTFAIQSLPDLLAFMGEVPGFIINEYLEDMKQADFAILIAFKSWPARSYRTKLSRFSAQEGPNNLYRCRVDGTHCIGHGVGPVDLIKGTFS